MELILNILNLAMVLRKPNVDDDYHDILISGNIDETIRHEVDINTAQVNSNNIHVNKYFILTK
jgi:hypothetical protein